MSPICFGLSLSLPALYYGDYGVFNGSDLLFFGIAGILTGKIQWLANPLLMFIYYLIVRDKYDTVLVLSGIGFLLSLTTFLINTIPSDWSNSSPITGYGPGFYLWTLSFLIPLILSAIKVCINFQNGEYSKQ